MEHFVIDMMLLAEDAIHHSPCQTMEIMLEEVTRYCFIDPEYILV